MTKSIITRERVVDLIAEHSYDSALVDALEHLLAAMDSKPLFFIEVEADDWINAGRIEGKNRPDLGLLPDGINYLYAAPQPLTDAGWEELQELRRSYLALRGENEDLQAQLYEAENPADAATEELQECRKADREPAAEVLSNLPGNDTSTIDRALPVGTPLYGHVQPAPLVPEEMPSGLRRLIEAHTDRLFDDDDAQEIWSACRAAMLQELQKSAGDEAICRSNENVQVLHTIKAPSAMGLLPKNGELLHTNSPAQSDCCPAQNHVSPEQNGATPAQSQGWIPVSEQMPPSRHGVLVGRW
ncbi:hypothetical protein [Klebsiella quasipneumoniae]|uniref:hypothetical protein n=1 Tax=Klebsiella quasipneumoniae TaxID=1463165 RepID=UPI002FE3282F